jgi:hypothetical protein
VSASIATCPPVGWPADRSWTGAGSSCAAATGITRLSRLARSVRHLTELAAELEQRGVDLVVLQQGIDTRTPAGLLLFHISARWMSSPRT